MTARHELLDLSGSFVVEGAAGCGKTELALQRYLTALSSVKHPEEVLLIVDRDPAVSAVRQRVADILRGNEQTDTPFIDRNTELGWGLLEQPERLQIHTMSSLALALVAAAPVSSGCGAGVRLSRTPEDYYGTAARALLRTLDRDEAVAPNLETLLLHLDNDLVRAERLVSGMLRRRAELQGCLRLDQPNSNRDALQSALEDAVAMTLAEASSVLPDAVKGEIVSVASAAARNLSRSGSNSPITVWRDLRRLPAADAQHLAAWQGLSELLLDEDGDLRRNFGQDQGFPAVESADSDSERSSRAELNSRISILVSRLQEEPYLAARLRAVRHVSGVRYTHLQWTVLQSLLAVLPGVLKNLSRAFRALGQMDLTEILLGASRALKAGQAEIFGPRGLQHLIVDDAPELSFAGMELIERLTGSWTGTDDRSLFITGNPYASICRSDGAQPALFLKLLNNGLGKCALSLHSLTDQRQSGSAIVEWINRCFSHETDAVIAEGAMPFLVAAPAAESTGVVSIHGVAPGTANAAAAESQCIVNLLSEQPDLLNGSVGVLLAEGSGAASIIDSLRLAGIRCGSDAVDLLGHRSVIADLHALTRALCHLSDRVAWLSVLRAPWCGLNLHDLHRLTADSSQVSIWDLLIDEQRRARLSEDGQQRLSRIKRVMAQTLAERGRRDLRRLVEGVWTALGGAVSLRSAFELEQTRDFFRVLEQIDDGGEPDSLEALDEAVDRLCAERDSTTKDGVFVTTIRNAKRRTFDTVIVAGLSTTISLPEDDDALRWLVRPDQFGSAQLLLAPVSGEGHGDAINHWIKSLQISMHNNELRRLFYTGVTRAADNLHVVVSVPYAGAGGGSAGWCKPPKHSVVSAMWNELAGLLPAEPELVADRADESPQGHTIRRLPSSWLLPEAPQPKAWHSRETQASAVDNTPQVPRDDARIVAHVLTRTLTEMAQLGSFEWATRSLEGLENRFQQLFAMMGMDERSVSDVADRAGVVVREMLEDERARWLLNSTHKKSRAPLQLTGWLDNRLIDARIDRSFVDADGVRWIVGYHFPELDDDEELQPDSIADAQKPTWNDYARLARRLDPDPVRVGLYFPHSNSWREWDPES